AGADIVRRFHQKHRAIRVAGELWNGVVERNPRTNAFFPSRKCEVAQLAQIAPGGRRVSESDSGKGDAGVRSIGERESAKNVYRQDLRAAYLNLSRAQLQSTHRFVRGARSGGRPYQ